MFAYQDALRSNRNITRLGCAGIHGEDKLLIFHKTAGAKGLTVVYRGRLTKLTRLGHLDKIMTKKVPFEGTNDDPFGPVYLITRITWYHVHSVTLGSVGL